MWTSLSWTGGNTADGNPDTGLIATGGVPATLGAFAMASVFATTASFVALDTDYSNCFFAYSLCSGDAALKSMFFIALSKIL